MKSRWQNVLYICMCTAYTIVSNHFKTKKHISWQKLVNISFTEPAL